MLRSNEGVVTMFDLFTSTERLLIYFKPDPIYLLYTTVGISYIPKPDKKYKKLTVTVIGAGGHGGGGGGISMWGGTGGTGGLVTKIYMGSELSSLPQQIPISIGICPDSKGATGQSTYFNSTVIAYGGGGGGEGGFGYNGGTGANGSGTGGAVVQGSSDAQRTFNGVLFGKGGGGTQGGGSGYAGSQGCVYIVAE